MRRKCDYDPKTGRLMGKAKIKLTFQINLEDGLEEGEDPKWENFYFLLIKF